MSSHPAHSKHTVTPALLTSQAVMRLPRLALWLFCAAYILPGLFGRDPWKNADIASFGQMWSLALGHASWLNPQVAGLSPDGGGILPYWLGGAFIAMLQPFMDPALAARLPFGALLALVLAFTWYTTYHLALTPAAQPLPLAFGGEPKAPEYARALADGALLALISSLGLLRLGHETTPELLQLTGSAMLLYGLAAAAHHPIRARMATCASLLILAASGSPSVAVILAVLGSIVCFLSKDEAMQRHQKWMIAAGIMAASVAVLLSWNNMAAWSWRANSNLSWHEFLKLLTWFTWPTLPLAFFTVWSWRRQLMRRHIAVPLYSALVGIGACLAMHANDKALLHSLPPLAVLAAFALPVIKRGFSAAIDWFSVFFFSLAGLTIWIAYSALHTGWPAKTAKNVLKLVPGMTQEFSLLAMLIAILGTLTWLALVRWRTAKQRSAIWKSMVLPAGGVALIWLLTMTLLLPPLDQARSYRLLMHRLAAHIPSGTCVVAHDATVGLVTAMQYFGHHQVVPLSKLNQKSTACKFLVQSLSYQQAAPKKLGWHFIARVQQRTARSESVAVYQRER